MHGVYMKSAKSIVLSILLLFAIPGSRAIAATPIIDITLGQDSYQVELAVTPEQRRKGLMYREQLAPDRGMLLVYAQSGDHRVWMKNMRIPIRVFWINADFTVVAWQRMEPCTGTPCTVYASARPSRYVLELGDYDHALLPGDKIEELSDLQQ
jgi:uncharacterized membrane protein (UPF0127 family)